MKASFVVPLYNCLPLTQAMLASLRATLPAGLAAEVIFVDDGSTDGTREWLQGLGSPATEVPCRVVLNEHNLGFAGACNRGAAAATGEFLYLLNNDLVLLPGWLEPMQAALESRDDAGLVGNIQLNAATGAVDHAGLAFNAKGQPEHVRRRPWLGGTRTVVALTGACCAIRRDRWVALGGFDEGFVNGGEDIDLCFRARARGWRNLLVTGSIVRHHVSQSPGRKRRDEANSRRFLRRWRSAVAPLIARGHCRALLSVAWDDPRQYPDPRLALDAFLHGAGLLPFPTKRLLAAADARLEIEFARWAHLLDGALPPADDGDIVWQLRRKPPPPQLVL